MKRLLIVCMALVSFSFGFVANSNAEENLLQNPGFEESNWPPLYWSSWDGGGGVVGYLTQAYFHSGIQSAARKLYGSGIRWGGYSQEDVPVNEGVLVTASGWLMNNTSHHPLANGAEAFIELKFLNAGGAQLALHRSAALTEPSPWVQHSISEYAPTGTAKAVFSFVLLGTMKNSSGIVYFDDAWLEQDTTPPVVTITSPEDQSITEVSPITVSGTVDDPTVTTIDVNGNIEPVTGGSWTSSVSLDEGANIITATATDGSGNEGSDSITVYYDPPYPNLLYNAGFEASPWPPIYWSSWDGGGGVVGYLQQVYFHSGIQSAARKLYGSGIRWGGYSQEDVPVNEGDLVIASGWLMSNASSYPLADGAEAFIELKFLDAGDNELALHRSDPITGPTSWVQHYIVQQAPTGTAKAVFSFVLLGTENSSGIVYFDDAWLEVDYPPVVNILSPPDGAIVSASIIPVAGTVDDMAISSIDLNGNQIPCYEGKWETNFSVVIGENVITATAMDAASQIGTDTATITYDPNASTDLFDIIYPADEAVFYETPALVTATLLNPEDLYINIDGKEYLAIDGALIAHVPITAEENTLELRCHDQTGYEEVKYLNVTYDTSETDFGGAIANNSFENSGFPQKDWGRWSGCGSLSPEDGSASFISLTYARTGSQSSGQVLYGSSIRWGGLSQEFSVIPGDTINASGYVASFSADDPLTGGAAAWIEIKYISNRSNEIEKHKSEEITAPTDSWVQLSVSSTVPDGVETAILSFYQGGPDGASGTVYFDDAYVEIIDEGYTPEPKDPFDKPQSTGSVQISGNTILVDGEPFTIKGVCYAPIPIGYGHGEYDVYNDPGIYNRDLPLLRDMGANTMRTYEKITSTAFLDACYHGGVNPVYVVMGFYIDGYSDLSDPLVRAAIKAEFEDYVSTYKDYPAVLMWSPGNETEYTYAGSDRDYFTLLNELAEVAYIEEGNTYHPVTAVVLNVFSMGDNALLTTDEDMDYLDVWGGNIYEGKDFGYRFDDFIHRSAKVFWIPEFGVDAWHTNDHYGDPADGYLDEASQAEWNNALWDDLASRTDVCSGGTVFEYTDEWWKDWDANDPDAHDYGGYRMADTIDHPDRYTSEEWFGVFAVSDNGDDPDILTPRETFDGLKSRWYTPVNILQNPGFEESDWPPIYWSSWDGGGGIVGYFNYNYYHSGIKSAAKQLYGSGIRWGGYSQENIPVSEGTFVTASGWLMSNTLAGGAEAFIELKFWDASNNELALHRSAPLTGPSSWVQHSITEQAPTGTAKAVFSFVLLGIEGSTGTVYYDDAFLEVD